MNNNRYLMHVLSFRRLILNYRERKSFLTVGGVRITGSENRIPLVLIASKLAKILEVFTFLLLNNQRPEKQGVRGEVQS